MECQKGEGQNASPLMMVVPKVVLVAAVVGAGACARRWRHRHLRDGVSGVEGHECGHCHRHGCSPRGSLEPGADRENPTSSTGPVRILEERYASGVIDEEEFRHRRGVLLEHTH